MPYMQLIQIVSWWMKCSVNARTFSASMQFTHGTVVPFTEFHSLAENYAKYFSLWRNKNGTHSSVAVFVCEQWPTMATHRLNPQHRCNCSDEFIAFGHRTSVRWSIGVALEETWLTRLPNGTKVETNLTKLTDTRSSIQSNQLSNQTFSMFNCIARPMYTQAKAIKIFMKSLESMTRHLTHSIGSIVRFIKLLFDWPTFRFDSLKNPIF